MPAKATARSGVTSTPAPTGLANGSFANGAYQPPLDLQMTLSRPTYAPGAVVDAAITCTNISQGDLEMRDFPPDLEIRHVTTGVVVKTIILAQSAKSLATGDSLTQAYSWDQRDDSGALVPAGNYYVEVYNHVGEGVFGWATNGQASGTILIQQPHGALVKTVPVGQSAVVNDVTLWLDAIDFGATKTTVHARAIPAGYNFPGGATQPPSPPDSIEPLQPMAAYSTDGGTPVEVHGGYNPRVNDIELVWELDPVPADASRLDFTVTTLGRFPGPWPFSIQLR